MHSRRTTIEMCVSRRLLAAMFIVLLFAELGSHGVIWACEHTSPGTSVEASSEGHHDPCLNLIFCRHEHERERGSQSSPDAPQHAGIVTQMSHTVPSGLYARAVAPVSFAPARGLFRPVTPPFHPPRSV